MKVGDLVKVKTVAEQPLLSPQLEVLSKSV